MKLHNIHLSEKIFSQILNENYKFYAYNSLILSIGSPKEVSVFFDFLQQRTKLIVTTNLYKTEINYNTSLLTYQNIEVSLGNRLKQAFYNHKNAINKNITITKQLINK